MSIERDKKGYFVAGKSANPGGRAKVPPEVKEALRAACPKAVSTLIALLDDKKPIMRLKAACEILDRAYGKPVQMQAVTVDVDEAHDMTAYIRRVIMENGDDGGRNTLAS